MTVLVAYTKVGAPKSSTAVQAQRTGRATRNTGDVAGVCTRRRETPQREEVVNASRYNEFPFLAIEDVSRHKAQVKALDWL